MTFDNMTHFWTNEESIIIDTFFDQMPFDYLHFFIQHLFDQMPFDHSTRFLFLIEAILRTIPAATNVRKVLIASNWTNSEK